MTIISFTSADFFTLISFEISANIFMPTNTPTFASLLFLPYICLLIIKDITKPFFTKKLVTSVNNTTISIYIQSKI